MIDTVTNTYDMTDTSNVVSLFVVYQDGTESFVPLDEANADYAEIKRQVDAGELTIEDAD